MILLDSDMLSLYHAGHPRVTERMAKVPPAEIVGTTSATRAEILRARCEFLLKAADGKEFQRAQDWLDKSESLLAELYIAKVDAGAAAEFDLLRRRKNLKTVGYADLLIASIALAHEATLVTRNLKHFRQIPNLKLENWAD